MTKRNWENAAVRECDYCSHTDLTVINSEGKNICAICCDEEYTQKLENELFAAKAKLLAYEQADKTTDLKTLVISEIVDFYAGFESPGEPENVEEAQRQLIKRVENVFGLAAPVLPKQSDGALTNEDTNKC